MLKGQFCFIKPGFFEKYDKEKKLLQNKAATTDGQHNRPCFFVFDDSQEQEIYWCVPISSQIDKYENIREHRLSKMRERGMENPICHEIAFGKVIGESRAFLLRNMFPVTEKYIENYYVGRDGKPVTISEQSANFIRNSARKLLTQHNNGQRYIFFADIMQIKRGLLAELAEERGTPLPEVKQGKTRGATFVPYNKRTRRPPQKEERVRPTQPQKGTMEEYAKSIVAERQKAINERKTAERRERPTKAVGREQSK